MEKVKRVRYFDHEFLEAADFEVEQEYHRGMRYRHTRHFHTWGLAHNGLEVDFAEGQETGEETKVVVLPGIALDNEGREIVLPESRKIDFDQPNYEGEKSYYITIRWHEQQGLPRQENELKRWEETPFIDATVDKPLEKDLNLVLAYVKLREDRSVESIDDSNSQRRYAAHEVGNYTVTSVKIMGADGISGQDIHRGDGIKTDHIQDRAVTAVKLDEDVEKSLIPAGCVAAFAFETPPDSWLECNGQAIDRNEYKRLFNAIGTTFGAGNGETTFNVPDLRGEFIRGWDGGSKGSKGIDSNRNFGSGQYDQIQGHKHTDAGTPRCGSETRPRNVALMYCIKY